MHQVLVGDCRELLRQLPDASVDSVATDPPYHLTSIVKRFSRTDMGREHHARSNLEQPADKNLGNVKAGQYARLAKGFMGQQWDGGDTAFQAELWAEVLRVLKPGGHLVAFSGTRTYHRMACAIEDAGFEIRDQLGWAYGSGFPKSHDIAKAIDKAAGVRGHDSKGFNAAGGIERTNGKDKFRSDHPDYVKPTGITDEAKGWEGWGTALKPAWEPICLARKPLSEKSVAANVLRWGTGALNIDGCRIEARADDSNVRSTVAANNARNNFGGGADAREPRAHSSPEGRWPANLVHDGSDEVLAGFPDTQTNGGGDRTSAKSVFGIGDTGKLRPGGEADSGSAARFFYCAKASKWDRLGSDHPTVKPVELMRWLVRLITPPGGLVLDPFAGTGSTGIAAHLEGFRCTMMELREEAAEDIRRRLAFIQGQGGHSVGEKHKSRLNKSEHRSKAAGEDTPLFGGSA